MRMRKKKNSSTRLALCEKYLYAHEGEPMADPASVFGKSGAPVYLEIGAGKGRFACSMAQRHDDCCYFAMERVTDCVVLAAERAASGEYGELTNLRFLIDTADNLMHLFGKGTVDTILLNFSDPWSKKGYAKRRLTHRRYLAVYMNLLRDGGVFISLIKPQFEAGRAALGKNGVVHSSAYRFLAAKRVISFACENGFDCYGLIRSPIEGGDGNKEYLAYFVKRECVTPRVDDKLIKRITAL